MATTYSIDDAKKLFSDRAGTMGISGNISPDKFNRFWNSAELKFFNIHFAEYARTQAISDSISKWFSDELFLPIPLTGVYPFFTGMNLLHVNSMSNYYPIPNGIGTLNTLVGGSGYIAGTYQNVQLTGGLGTGAFATIVVNMNGIVSSVTLTNIGSGYAINDVLSASLFGGTGFTIKVSTLAGTMISTLGTLTAGTGYVNNTYRNVALTGGSGSGATAMIVVNNTNVVSAILTQQGSGYTVGDSLTTANTNLGGTGSGFSILVASVTGAVTDNPVTRVEKELVAPNLQSVYDYPTQQFPIYTQYSTSFKFWPNNIGFVKIVYLQQPTWSYWGYNLQGYISTLTGLVGGSTYTNGTYTNVPLTGGLGNGALATITVAGNVVTQVTLTNQGKIYAVGDVLSAASANIGGTGSGFSITVSSLVAGSIRAVYNAATSIQFLWNNDDVNTIVDLALQDAAIANRDKELGQFSNITSKAQQ